jgi:katanin p60 ATPase-containing subunit A1
MPNFDGDSELRSLAMIIRRDIVQENPLVHWNEIVGLEDAKSLLHETIILPRKYPELFTGIRSPWKGILLYGMPGTGKTLLAKAVATEGMTTFFNISASSIVSKFRGDSEKLIRMLFDLARHYSPSTIFLDEVDSIMCHRGGGGGFGSSMSEGSSEHEGSRRMKTELLLQMDGLLTANNNSGVFVLAASNLPWDLDPAFLRRMEKRIMIPLPNADCRKEIICSQLSQFSTIFSKGAFLDSAASLVDGYSGSDLKALCKEVAMRPLRRILNDPRVLDGTMNNENISLLMKRNPITAQDFQDAIAAVSHSTSTELCDRYREWMVAHGSSC